MSKDGFVRDNLIDMRDHLKVAREAILAGNNPHEAARRAEAASTAKGDAKNPPSSAQASPAAKNNSCADPRSLRELLLVGGLIPRIGRQMPLISPVSVCVWDFRRLP